MSCSTFWHRFHNPPFLIPTPSASLEAWMPVAKLRNGCQPFSSLQIWKFCSYWDRENPGLGPESRSCSALTIPWNDRGMQVRAWPLDDPWIKDTYCMHLFAVIFWIVSSSEGVNMGNGIMVRKHGVKQPKKWNIFTEQKMGDRPMGIFIFISKSQDLQGMPFFFVGPWIHRTSVEIYPLPVAHGIGCDRMWSPTTHWWAAVNVPAFGRQCLGSCGVTEPIYQHLTSKLLERTYVRFRLVEIPFLIPMTDPWCCYIC